MKKLFVIGVVLLMCASIVPLAAAQDGARTTVNTPQTLEVIWSDNFDSYTNGQMLDGGTDDGGWQGWDGVAGAGAPVTDAMAQSVPHSVLITGASDLVHKYSGVTEGAFTYKAMQYIPTDFEGISYFLLLSDYTDGGPYIWQLQLAFDSELMVVTSEFDAVTLPLIMGRWVEIRVEGNLTSDWMQVYYDSELLIEKAWTAGPNNQMDGLLNLACVDLYANAASPVYYDDLSLEVAGGVPPQPDIEIGAITGGKAIGATIQNVGEGDATNVAWTIALDGGLILKGKETTGTVATIAAGADAAATASVFGIGKVTITVTATCDEGDTATKTASGFVFIIFVLGVA